MKYWFWRKREDFCWWLARKLPARVKYYAFNLVMGHATTGEYGHLFANEVTWQQASQWYAKDHKL
jgi:hypothetical protein